MKFKDTIFTNIEINISFIDRIRILFGTSINVRVETDTENLPGKCESRSYALVSQMKRKKDVKVITAV